MPEIRATLYWNRSTNEWEPTSETWATSVSNLKQWNDQPGNQWAIIDEVHGWAIGVWRDEIQQIWRDPNAKS